MTIAGSVVYTRLASNSARVSFAGAKVYFGGVFTYSFMFVEGKEGQRHRISVEGSGNLSRSMVGVLSST